MSVERLRWLARNGQREYRSLVSAESPRWPRPSGACCALPSLTAFDRSSACVAREGSRPAAPFNPTRIRPHASPTDCGARSLRSLCSSSLAWNDSRPCSRVASLPARVPRAPYGRPLWARESARAASRWPGARACALRRPREPGEGQACGAVLGGNERGCPLDPSRATVSANAVSANVERRSLRAKRAGPSSGISTAVTEGNEDRSEPRMVERAGAFDTPIATARPLPSLPHVSISASGVHSGSSSNSEGEEDF